MANLIFKFSVDAQGEFKYDEFLPPGATQPVKNWPYTHQDTVEFHCDKGPFTIRQRRTDSAAPGLSDSFGGPVKAKQEGNIWVAKTAVNDGLSAQLRTQLFKANGFIAKYRYVFGLQNGTEIAVDDNHPGIQTC